MSMIFFDQSQLQRWGGMLREETVSVGLRVERAVAEQQADIHAAALAQVGHQSGRLKGTIRPSGRGLRRRVRAGGARAVYGGHHEFGARSFPGNPFLLGQVTAQRRQEFTAAVLAAVMAGRIYR